MVLIGKNIIKRIKRNSDSIHSKEETEKGFNQLKENVIYSQQLAHIGSWTYNIQKDEAFWTEEIYHILECSPQALGGKLQSFLPYVHADDLEKVKAATQNAFEGKEYDIEYRIITSGGAEKYVHEKAKVVYDENKKPIKMVGIIQDITERKLIESNWKRLGDHLNFAQHMSGVGIWKYDVIKDEFYGSEEMFRIYGISSMEFNNDFSNTIKLIHPEDQIIIQNAMEQHLTGKPCEVEFRILQTDGTIKYVIGKGEPLFDANGQVVGVLGILQDITEKKKLQREIERKQEEVNKIQKKFQILVQESSDVFEIISRDGTIKYISEAVEKIIGYKPEERIGKKIYEFYEGAELQKLTKMVDFVLNDSSKKVQGDVILRTKSGKDIYLEINMQNLLHEPTIEGIVLNFRDITKRVETEKRMAYISTHDELTGLPNSVYFKRKLRLQCQHAKETHAKFGLMMLCIDGLNYINYALGYEFGQRIIIEIGKRLRTFLGKDKFICRYSDDHFAIIEHGLDTYGEYENIVKGLIALFSQPYKVDKYELDVSVNIGVCIYHDGEQDMDSLIKQSLAALLRAKKEGKNTYKFHSPNLDIQNYKEFLFRNDLRNAAENGQLSVHYQPMVHMKTNEILAAEALIRWEHPDWGMVSPVEFFHMAEETGLIIYIGKWVLREICKTYRQWLNKGLPAIKVSANFSSIQFLENDFVDHIINIIDEFKLDPHFLIMEITESILIKKTDKVISDIQRLQSFGIQVALDDFGTGYSSLAYLNSFNIDILKIDASFIKKVPTDNTSATITKHIINLTKELKIKLVVEGIENWEQLSLLKELNCYTGQGFIYSKPVPLENFEKILARRKCKPIIANNAALMSRKNRRKFFRIKFSQLLEAEMTILEIRGKKINVGNTKILIKDIGPGGLCFISDIKLPVERDLILQFTTQLLEKELKVYGCSVWAEEIDDKLYEYGVEFTFDENDRAYLVRVLNQVQIKMRNDILFADGSFISDPPNFYFKSHAT